MVIATPNLNLQKPENADDAGQYLNGTIAGGGLHATLDTLDQAALLTAAQTLTNKTIITPTIASFVNAQHNHANAAGGGALGAGATLNNPTLVDPTISGAVQGTLAVTGDITIQEATAGLNLFSPGLGLNEKRWVHNIETNNLVFRAVSDDSLSSTGWLTVTRSGITPTQILFNPAITVGASAAAAGHIRLPNASGVNWRNAANTGDVGIAIGGSNELSMANIPTAASANAGGVGSLPATVAGFLLASHNGTLIKIPFYSN